MRVPLAAETIALVLEGDHRGRTVVVVDGTEAPDCVLEVTERIVDSIAIAGRPAHWCSPRSVRVVARQPRTATCGSRPVSWPKRRVSSCSAGSSSPTTPAHRRRGAHVTSWPNHHGGGRDDDCQLTRARRSAGVRRNPAAPGVAPVSGCRPRSLRRQRCPPDAPRERRSGHPGRRGGGSRGGWRSRAARRARCRSRGGTSAGRATTRAVRRRVRPPVQFDSLFGVRWCTSE